MNSRKWTTNITNKKKDYKDRFESNIGIKDYNTFSSMGVSIQ